MPHDSNKQKRQPTRRNRDPVCIDCGGAHPVSICRFMRIFWLLENRCRRCGITVEFSGDYCLQCTLIRAAERFKDKWLNG